MTESKTGTEKKKNFQLLKPMKIIIVIHLMRILLNQKLFRWTMNKNKTTTNAYCVAETRIGQQKWHSQWSAVKQFWDRVWGVIYFISSVQFAKRMENGGQNNAK